MSENMKEIYQAYAEAIAPEPDMQARLKRRLYAEIQEDTKQSQRIRRTHFYRWLVVACMFLVVSGSCLTYAVMQTSGRTERGRWMVRKSADESRMLVEKSIADTDFTRYAEDEQPWLLQNMLQADSVMVICDQADADGSRKQTRMGTEDIQRLCDSLQSAVVCKNGTVTSVEEKSAVSYQVLLQYKPLINFTIYDGMYLQIGDETTIYKIKN